MLMLKGRKSLRISNLALLLFVFPSGGAESMAMERSISAWQRLEEFRVKKKKKKKGSSSKNKNK